MIPLHDDNPTRTFSFCTILMILTNGSVFCYQWTLHTSHQEAAFLWQFAMIPHQILGSASLGEYKTLITSMFLHAGLLHLLGNMLYLWIFGNNIEDTLGHFRFLVFYLLCGLAAAGAHLLSNPQSTIPTVGASGAISGILGAYLILHPQARVLTLVPLGFFTRLIYLPAWFFLIVWFGMQLLSGWVNVGSKQVGGVAWWAHIGGFIAGIVLAPLLKLRK
jgi:membrane associated rhomboid family serine protease